MHIRARRAGEFLIGVLLLGAGIRADAAPRVEIRYACDSGQQLLVVQSAHQASVRFLGRSYELEKAPSDIGQKFISSTAALIIDGSSAVFVAEDHLWLRQCLEVSRTERSR